MNKLVIVGLLALITAPAWAGGSCTDPNGGGARCGGTPDSIGQEDKKKPPKPKPDCLDGTVYDDGKFESGLAPNALLNRDDLVMLFTSPSYPVKLEKLCVAWWRAGFDSGIFFDLHVWAADGPDGAPGTLLETISSLSSGGIKPKAKFYTYDLSAYNLVFDGPVYIGPSWDPLNPFLVYLAMDTSAKTPRQRGFYGVGIFNDHAPNQELGVVGRIPQYKALAIRAKFGNP